ncbi:MAG TPA: IS1182 family transposase [Kofleriaceae bacterium]|nr:IS1182 family transposase [Kofleriaceae bacterium]
MAIARWNPRTSYAKQEERLLGRLRRTKKLYAFLRDHRHELFDEAFQDELAGMYRDTGAGKDARPPALLAMALLLQAYEGASDAEAVELTVVDLRWQMVLDRLGCEEPAFAQGTLQAFRERMIRTDMDRRLLERTVELARQTRAFDWKKLPKAVRVAIDSAPLAGAGRVEDTLNLLAHAARNVAVCAAALLDWPLERLATTAGAPMLLEPSIKRALDREWGTAQATIDALNDLLSQIDALQRWMTAALGDQLKHAPLSEYLATLSQIRDQDLEPDPSGNGRSRIRDHVAEERRISVSDPEMRHGRKSKSRRIDGYKRHIAVDLDTQLIIGCAVTPANRPEAEAALPLQRDIQRIATRIGEMHCDRGYIASPLMTELCRAGAQIFCKPWIARNGNLFTKSAFTTNLRSMTITCPAGETQPIKLGAHVKFPPSRCDACALRARCTDASPGIGRTISIANDEPLQKKLRALMSSRTGRARLRERVAVEHQLAHLVQRQGNRARYRGVRRNLFDVRRAASLQNLETTHRQLSLGAGAGAMSRSAA